MPSTITEAPETLLVQAAQALRLPVETVLAVAECPNDLDLLIYRTALTHYLRRTLKLSYPKIAYLLHDGGHTTPLMRNKLPCTRFCNCEGD